MDAHSLICTGKVHFHFNYSNIQKDYFTFLVRHFFSLLLIYNHESKIEQSAEISTTIPLFGILLMLFSVSQGNETTSISKW